MSDRHEQLAKLREDFPSSAIGKLPRVTCKDCSKAPSRVCAKHKKSKCAECGNYITTAHIHLDYVGHAHVRERLLEADPEWTWEPFAVDETGLPACVTVNGSPVGLWIRLTVCGVTRPGYGSCPPGKEEAVKELIGDALRNAAQSFGVALSLWKKEPHAEDEAPKAAPAPAPQPAAPSSDDQARDVEVKTLLIKHRKSTKHVREICEELQGEGTKVPDLSPENFEVLKERLSAAPQSVAS